MRGLFCSTFLIFLTLFLVLSAVGSPLGREASLRWSPPGGTVENSPLFENQALDVRNRLDREVVQYVNEMRHDPKAFYQKYIPDYIKRHPGRFTAQYTHSLKKTMYSSGPLPLFEPSAALESCASRQYKYLARFKGRQLTHEQGSISFAERMKQAGLHCLAENLYDADSPKAIEVVIDLLIDQHIPSLGHRKNLMNPVYTHIGVISGTPAGGRTIVVMDFGCKTK